MTEKKTVRELVKEFHDLRDELSKKLQKEFTVLIKEVFEDQPDVYGIAWTQYTPYFNDGEPCEFSVCEMWPVPSFEKYKELRSTSEDFDKDTDEEDIEDEYNDLLRRPNNIEDFTYSIKWMEYGSPEKKDFEESVAEIQNIPDDIFRDMFGDHVSVLATRENIETEEYEHD